MGQEKSEVTGGCHCGRIRYKATLPAVKCTVCKCSGCVHATGTFEAAFITFKEGAFTITDGTLSSYQKEGGSHCDNGVWYFCKDCGTQVYWKGHDYPDYDFFAGTLDDASVYVAPPKN